MSYQILHVCHHGKFPRFDYHGQKRIHQPRYIIEACRHPAIFQLSCIRKLHGYIDTQMYRLVDDGQQFFKESFRNFMGMLLNDRREFSLCIHQDCNCRRKPPMADEDSKIHFGGRSRIPKEHIRHHEEGLTRNRDKEGTANIHHTIAP